jgi:hypothetical protein
MWEVIKSLQLFLSFFCLDIWKNVIKMILIEEAGQMWL